MKKHLALLLAAFMMLGLIVAPVMAEEEEFEPEIEDMVDSETLVVGAPELNADYVNGFGNSAYDVYIKCLIGNYDGELSYDTMFPNREGELVLNETVCPCMPEVIENEDGSKTYSFEIYDDLVWNDGEPITAKDYVFGAFFISSPEWRAQGANNAFGSETLVGFDAYSAGETRVFEGLHVIDDTHFSITIKAEELPYFYEDFNAACGPTPMHRYAPNLDIIDNELVVKEGYEVTDEDIENIASFAEIAVDDAQKDLDDEQAWWDANCEEYAEWEDEELAELAALEAKVEEAKQYVEDIKNGEVEMDAMESLMTEAAMDVAYNYRFNPDVTCGPYQFVSYENQMAKVTINPLFKGDSKGQKPQIKNIIVQTVNSQLEPDYLLAGYIDLLIGEMNAPKINKLKEHPDKVAYCNYPRNGYGLIPFRGDYSPTQYKEVRRAIAFCFDRDQFVAEIAGGYGIVVDGAFGISEWEYQARGAELEANPEWTHYTLNIDAANAELDNTPYLYEADGETPWDAEKAQAMYDEDGDNFDYWRYDEDGNELRIIHQGAEGIDTTALIQIMLPDQARLAGMNYIVQPVDFATLLDYYYGDTPEDPKDVPSAFNMGTGFGIPHDPYWSYHSKFIGVGSNHTYTNDPWVDEHLETMRKLDPTDKEGWLDGWVEWQLWYNENLPDLPLYANDYHDFHSVRIKGMETNSLWDWYRDICNMYIEEDGE